jgi:hypothetical protein
MCHGRAKPQRHQDKPWTQENHPLLVMPGLDPGIPTTDGIRGDHRVKPGDDGERDGDGDGEVWRFGQNNAPPDPYPDAYGDKPGHYTETQIATQATIWPIHGNSRHTTSNDPATPHKHTPRAADSPAAREGARVRNKHFVLPFTGVSSIFTSRSKGTYDDQSQRSYRPLSSNH